METKKLTDNELIAEFMGGKYDDPSHSWTGLPKKNGGYSTPVNWAWDSNDLLYHSSWDWLMPPIKKAIDIYGIDECRKLIESLQNVDITACFNELVNVLNNGKGK